MSDCNSSLFNKLPWLGDSEGTFRSLGQAATCLQGLREKFLQGVRRSTPGPQNLAKLNQERSSLKFGPDFCPKLGEDQKKRSSLKFGPDFCPKLGEDQKKRSSLKFGPDFCPKLGEDQKKRSSLKFGPDFCPKLGEDQKKKVFTQIWSCWSKT